MSNTCEPVGGVRLIGPDGSAEFISFPAGVEREAFLNSLDPDIEVAAREAMEEGRVFDMNVVGASTNEGEEYEVQVWDGNDVYVLGPIDHDLESRLRPMRTRNRLCEAAITGGTVLFFGGGFAAGSVKDETKGWYAIGAALTGVGVVMLASATVCRATPRPPLPPLSSSGGDSVVRPYGVRGGRGGAVRQILDPVLVIPLAILGALLLAASGGSLAFQGAGGFGLSVGSTGNQEIY